MQVQWMQVQWTFELYTVILIINAWKLSEKAFFEKVLFRKPTVVDRLTERIPCLLLKTSKLLSLYSSQRKTSKGIVKKMQVQWTTYADTVDFWPKSRNNFVHCTCIRLYIKGVTQPGWANPFVSFIGIPVLELSRE